MNESFRLGENFIVRHLCATVTRLAVVFIGTICLPQEYLHAAPVTFQFDATVTGVFPGGAFNSPISLHVGDEIKGRLTFDPTIGAPFGDNAFDAIQDFPLTFTINGTVISSSQYGMRIINDSPIFDSSLPVEIADDLTLTCSPSSARACTPALISIPGAEPFRMTARLALLGESSVFATAYISDESEIWNSMNLVRSLRLTVDNLAGGGLLIDCAVGQFVTVPEPSAFVVTGLFAVFGQCLRLRIRYSHAAMLY